MIAKEGLVQLDRKEAIEGGVSDPRNGVMLKIFSLINYGERAGSGLNSIFHVWNHVYHNTAEIREDVGVDRVCLSLPNGGHEQDVKAMLELYDHPEELTFPSEEVSDWVSENDNNVRKNDISSEKMSEKQVVMLQLSKIMSEKLSEKLSEIIILAKSHEIISASDVVSLLSVDERQARRYLNRLVDLGYLEPEGVTKNKKYRYKA